MMMRTTRPWQLALLFLGGLMCANSNRLMAQPAEPKGEEAATDEDDRPAGDLEAKRRELRQRIRALRAERVSRAVGNIDDATRAKVTAALAASDAERAEVQKQIAATWRELRKAVQSSASDASIDARLDALEQLRQRRHRIETERIATLRRLLSPAQAARALGSMERVERAVGGRIRRALERRRARRRGHRGVVNPFEDASQDTDASGESETLDPFAERGRRGKRGKKGRRGKRGKGEDPQKGRQRREGGDLHDPFAE